MIPQIKVDQEKCRDPFTCRRCLIVCPTRVFGLAPIAPAKKYNILDLAQFRAAPHWLSSCTGCKDCITACPQNAISVHF